MAGACKQTLVSGSNISDLPRVFRRKQQKKLEAMDVSFHFVSFEAKCSS